MATLLETLARALAPLRRSIRLLAARGVVRVVDASGGRQRLQVALLAGEVADGVEHFQPHGFASHAPPGAESVCLFLGGNREHGLAVVTQRRGDGPTDLQPGEVEVYGPGGARVRIRADGTILLRSATRVVVDAGELVVSGTVRAQAVEDESGSMQAMREVYNLHTHVETGSTTAPPSTQMGVG